MAKGRYSVTRSALSRWFSGDMEGIRLLERLIDDVQALSIAAPYMVPLATAGTPPGLVFVVAPGGTLRSGRLTARNLSANTVALSVYAVPSGGSASAGNAVVSGQLVDPGEYFDITLPAVVSGTEIRAEAGSANSITILQTGGDLQ